MSWRAALLSWCLALVLIAAYVWTTPPESTAPPRLPGVRAAARPAEPGPPAYELSRDRVAAVEVRRGDQVVRWVPSGGGWRVEHPVGAAVPPGILDALVEQIIDGAAGERLDGGSATDTGLDRPSLEVRVDRADGGRLTLSIGGRTPTATAVYGRVEETGTLFVAGLSFLTYADLLFAALR
jgi:hypothetical protein